MATTAPTMVNPTVYMTPDGQYRLYLTTHTTDANGYSTGIIAEQQVILSLSEACYLFDTLKELLPR